MIQWLPIISKNGINSQSNPFHVYMDLLRVIKILREMYMVQSRVANQMLH